MTPDELEAILNVWGEIYTNELRKTLKNKLYTFAPGYKLDAYSKGRNQQYSGQQNKIASGSLYKSIRYDVSNGLLQIYMAPHWKYVNYGVEAKGYTKKKSGGGGKSEFISALVNWSKTRLGLPQKEALSMAFATRINIFKFGIAPTNFIELSNKNAFKKAEQVLPEYVLEYLRTQFGL